MTEWWLIDKFIEYFTNSPYVHVVVVDHPFLVFTEKSFVIHKDFRDPQKGFWRKYTANPS